MAVPESRLKNGDPVKLDPQHYQVEYENDRFRVLRVKFGPNERSVTHWHPPGVVIILSDCDMKTLLPEGHARNIIGTPGQVIGFDEPLEHLPENMSAQPFEAIWVEVKS